MDAPFNAGTALSDGLCVHHVVVVVVRELAETQTEIKLRRKPNRDQKDTWNFTSRDF